MSEDDTLKRSDNYYLLLQILLLKNYRVAWLEVDGTKYSPTSIVVLEVTELPTFGIIADIVSSGAQYYFVCELLFTCCFNYHFHAYEVRNHDLPEYAVCSQCVRVCTAHVLKMI